MVCRCKYSSVVYQFSSYYLTLNNIVTLKSGHSKSLKMVTFERLNTTSYSSSTATILAVSETFRVKKWLELEIRVKGYSRWLEIAPFDRPHTSSCWPFVVTIALSCIIYEILVKNYDFCQPCCVRRPLWVSPIDRRRALVPGKQAASQPIQDGGSSVRH